LFKDFTFFHFHGCPLSFWVLYWLWGFETLRFYFFIIFFSGVDFFMCVC
jgi:hypothetical protein